MAMIHLYPGQWDLRNTEVERIQSTAEAKVIQVINLTGNKGFSNRIEGEISAEDTGVTASIIISPVKPAEQTDQEVYGIFLTRLSKGFRMISGTEIFQAFSEGGSRKWMKNQIGIYTEGTVIKLIPNSNWNDMNYRKLTKTGWIAIQPQEAQPELYKSGIPEYNHRRI